MDDQDLILAARYGDQKAATELYNKYKKYGYYCARKTIKVWNDAGAELLNDIVNDAFVTALQTYNSTSESSFGTWFAWQVRGAVSHSLSYRGAQRRQAELCNIDPYEEILPNIADDVLDVSDLWYVIDHVDLKPRARTTLELLYRCGYSIKDVAGLLGVSRQAIDQILKSSISKIIENLAQNKAIVRKT